MFEYNESQKYTEKWFDGMIPMWEKVFTLKKPSSEINNVLEIGCYEGRATSFVCEKFLSKGTKYDIVDTFGGSLEESGMSGTADRLEEDDFIYNNFKHNISFYPDIDFNIYREYSQHALPKLEKEGKKYDFIYVDASHRADDTFVDAYYAHKMLNPKGLLIFDDYGWKDPHQPHPVNCPELGIKLFFTMYENLYKMVAQGYQIIAIKN